MSVLIMRASVFGKCFGDYGIRIPTMSGERNATEGIASSGCSWFCSGPRPFGQLAPPRLPVTRQRTRGARLCGMSTIVSIPDDVAAGLAAEAAKRDMSPDALAAEYIAERVRPRRHRLGSGPLGASTSGRHAVEDEEMLAEGFGR